MESRDTKTKRMCPLEHRVEGWEPLETRTSKLSWFNPSQQLSTTQLLAHFPIPLPQWDGEENHEKDKWVKVKAV